MIPVNILSSPGYDDEAEVGADALHVPKFNAGNEPGGPNPLTCISGAASAPSSEGAMYSTSSSTRFDRMKAPANRGPHSTSNSLTSSSVKRSMTARRSRPPATRGRRSTLAECNERAGASIAANTSAASP